MSDPLMLVFCGNHTDSLGQEHSLLNYGSLYHYLFSRVIPVRYLKAGSIHQISKCLAALTENAHDLVYLVFVGRGSATSTTIYPWISPGDGTLADLVDIPLIHNARKQQISFRIILDCCNVSPILLKMHTTHERLPYQLDDNLIKRRITTFLSFPFQYLCMRQETLNFTQDANATILNSALLEAIINYDYEDLSKLLTIANARLYGKYQAARNYPVAMRRLLFSDVAYTYRGWNSVVAEYLDPNIKWTVLPSDYPAPVQSLMSIEGNAEENGSILADRSSELKKIIF